MIRLFSSIIGLGLSLLLLPLRIFRPLLGIALVPLRIAVKLLTRNLFIVAVIIIGILLYRAFDSGRASLPEVRPAPAPTTAAAGAQPIGPIDPVLKHEDGDSNFATDLYAAMNDAERATYSAHYYHAMNSVADGQAYAWTGGNIAGSVRPGAVFRNNNGVRCRQFTEVLKVHTIQQTLSGTGCEQGNGAWCKLKPNATPACNLGGYRPGIIDSILNSF